MIISGLRAPLWRRGAGGIPATTILLAQDLLKQATSITWTITDKGGFEGCTITIPGTTADYLFFSDELMASTIITGPFDTIPCWEGFLTEVAVTLGQERHSRSLDGMANRVICRYTTVNGVPGVTASASDTPSQALYGITDAVVPLPSVTTAEAEAFRDRTLDQTRYPVKRPSSEARTGDMGTIQIELHFAGWYGALGWVLTSRTDTTTEVTTTQLADLISTSGVGIGVTNAFLNTSTLFITASSVAATRKIDADTTYQAKIEALLSQGSGSGRFAWGVYEDRTFVVEAWAGSSPATIHYYRDLGSGLILNPAGVPIPPWDIRPNRMYQIKQLLGSEVATNEAESASRYPVARVTFRADQSGVGVSLEPADTDDLMARLAFFDARGW